jgi:hypothetical protein
MCGIDKEVSSFSKETKGSDGLKARCRECTAIVYKKYAATHREQLALKRQQYYDEHPERIRDWQKAHPDKVKGYRRKHYEKFKK